MKNKLKKILVTMFTVLMLVTPLTAQASPDGCDIYFWTDDEDLGNGQILQHPLQWTVNTPGTEVTDADIIESVKAMLPTGTEWGYETFYDTISDVKGRNIAKRGQGCLAFSYWLTDAIYGTTPMTRYENTPENPILTQNFEFYMYDIVCYNTTVGSFHCGVVIGADPVNQTLTLAEGNVNGKVDWNRVIHVDGSDGNGIARVYRREVQ